MGFEVGFEAVKSHFQLTCDDVLGFQLFSRALIQLLCGELGLVFIDLIVKLYKRNRCSFKF